MIKHRWEKKHVWYLNAALMDARQHKIVDYKLIVNIGLHVGPFTTKEYLGLICRLRELKGVMNHCKDRHNNPEHDMREKLKGIRLRGCQESRTKQHKSGSIFKDALCK